MDGECYYGTPWPEKGRLLVDGHAAAFRYFVHHYSVFSHHNSFWPLDDEATPTPMNKSLNRWMAVPLNTSFVEHYQLPIGPVYLAAAPNRTIYEYIRDHLGYRIELQSVHLEWGPTTSSGVTVSLAVTLVNRGFAAPQNPRDLTVVVFADEKAIGSISTAVDWRTWQPHAPMDPLSQPLVHQFNVSGKVTLQAMGLPTRNNFTTTTTPTYRVGILLRDPLGKAAAGCKADASVRFARCTRLACKYCCMLDMI
jgi:hypothetical protein